MAVSEYVTDSRDLIGEVYDPMYFYPAWFMLGIFATWYLTMAWLWLKEIEERRRVKHGREPVV